MYCGQNRTGGAQVIRLNLGCGPNMFPGWLNSDRVDMSGYLDTLRNAGDISTWPKHQQEIAHHARNADVSCSVWDIRNGTGHPDNSVDAIYLGQMVEHMNPVQELPKFLGDCWRTLKPGGCIRITTPDLGLLLAAYNAGAMDQFKDEQPDYYMTVPPGAQLSFLMFGATGPNCTRDNYEGHFMCWDRDSMRGLLTGIGFNDVQFDVKSGIFAECVDVGESHSMFVEAVKP